MVLYLVASQMMEIHTAREKPIAVQNALKRNVMDTHQIRLVWWV